ncbi:sugar-phosphatase [Motilibacter peucedani]|uniref:Sugar-phosphatase n=1 Tax=Motilibacter peucedani TaxID=598650 RepID=A0A420XKN9_9ACTN|nr:HAD-IA family hydrolase [Motilibacter peucedani]RKS68475.1 sugar-phosphatase [Motilibacter peucedani]
MTGPARRAVLFDVDGVLLDSYAVYRAVWDRWAGDHGLDPAAVWSETHGRRGLDTITTVAPHLDAAAELDRLQGYLAEQAPTMPAYPGAASLLSALPAGSWAVVTSGVDELVRASFAAAGVPAPGVVVDAHRVERGKPDPQGYLLAARELDVPPESCVVVEDAPAGVTAGRAAGMAVLGVATTHPPAALLAAGAARVVADLPTAAPLLVAWVLVGAAVA